MFKQKNLKFHLLFDAICMLPCIFALMRLDEWDDHIILYLLIFLVFWLIIAIHQLIIIVECMIAWYKKKEREFNIAISSFIVLLVDIGFGFFGLVDFLAHLIKS